MSAHTPGPWGFRLFRSKSHRIDAPGWSELAVVYGNEDDDLDRQGRANARLIAAAPELLDLVRDLRNAHDGAVNVSDDPFPDDLERSREWLERIRAAIAKAEGKS